jgi:opacity protein-like surface antigen
MRLLSRAALALAVILFTAPALHAQMSFNVALGAAVPMGDAADGVDLGYNATVGLGIKPPLAPLGVRVEGMFNSFEFKGPADASQRVMALTANGTFSVMPTIYLIGGLGMYNSKTSLANSSSSTDVGFNVGAGVNIPLTGFGTYIEARFHHVPGDNSRNFQFVPITVGMKF